MILLVRYANGAEESYRVSENTRLRECLHDGFWFFSSLDGGHIAIADQDVERITLGNVGDPEHVIDAASRDAA